MDTYYIDIEHATFLLFSLPGNNLLLFLELSLCDWITTGEEDDEVGNDVALGHVAQLVLKLKIDYTLNHVLEV